MAVGTEAGEVRHDRAAPARRPDRRRLLPWALPLGLVLVAVSPIVVGAVSLVGDTWHPVGDWASMLFRTSQVGTSETPLVGAYAVKGWAHPGPFLFWAAAPLHRLTGGDPRSLEWTAALLNCLAVGAIAAVAWRRGRGPLLVAVMLLTVLLIHGIEPGRMVDLWNPYVGLLPFLLTVLLAWDAALGRPRSLVPAAVAATVAIQCHVAFAALTGLVALWLVAWIRWWPRLLPAGPAGSAGSAGSAGWGAGGPADVRLPRPPWAPWRSALLAGLAVAAVLWLPPLVDLVFDTHNLASLAGHLLVGSGTQIGPTHGGSLVSRYVRPDGPWIGGPEPAELFSVQGSGPVPVFLVLAVLAGCLAVARRRRMVDVAALSTLTIVLVVGSVPAAANLVAPAFSYLTQWLKIVGGLVWFTVGWTAWRVAAPRLGASARRRAATTAVAALAVVGGAAWSWGEATRIETPVPVEGRVVQRLRTQVVDVLPADRRYRVEMVGDVVAHNGPGLVYYLIEDGYDVVTRDGVKGLKWGRDHRWSRGDPYDVTLTVAVHYPGDFDDAYQECLDDPGVEPVASHDELSAAERRELGDLRLRRVADDGGLTAAERRLADDLTADDFRVGVFAGDLACAQADPADPADPATED